MKEILSERIELDEGLARNQLVEALNRPNIPGQIPEIIKCKSTITEDSGKHESNFAFYHIFEPKMVDAKILELFCGGNTAKEYLKQKGLPGEVTGVDIENEAADIRTDVAKLPEKLTPEGQFDIVTSIGAHPGFESFSDDAAYLKEDGLYVHGMTEDWLDDKLEADILAWANSDREQIKDPTVREAAKYFQIAVILKIDGVHQISDGQDSKKIETDTSEYYFICKKAEVATEEVKIAENITDLPPLKEDCVRLIHITTPGNAKQILQGGLDYEKQGMISSTARAFNDEQGVPYSSDDPRFSGEGMKIVVMDVPHDQYRLHNDPTKSPGIMPAEYIVGIVDIQKPPKF